jgi:hypothetical protein
VNDFATVVGYLAILWYGCSALAWFLDAVASGIIEKLTR